MTSFFVMLTEHPKPLTTEVIRTTSELEKLRPQWTRMFDESKSTNPFARWEWTYHWWRAFGRPEGQVQDRLHILIHSDQGKNIQGITPLVKTTYRRGPFRISKLRNPGFVPSAYITEMPPYLWTPGSELEVVEALTDSLARQRREYEWVELGGIPLDKTFGRLIKLRYSGDGVWRKPTPYFPLPLPESWEKLRQGLSQNTREYLRQQRKKTERMVASGHQWNFDLVNQPEEIPEALDDFFKLHQARAEMVADPKNEFYHPNYFSNPATRQFMRNLAADLNLSSFGIARLAVDGQAVACRILMIANDHLFLYYSGFDPAWKDSGVMGILTTKSIQMAIESDQIKVVNLSTNIDPSKLRWKPEMDYQLGNLLIPSPASSIGRILVNLKTKNLPNLDQVITRI